MHDQLKDGRCFRLRNVLGDYSHEVLRIPAELSVLVTHVIRAFEQIIARQVKRKSLFTLILRQL